MSNSLSSICYIPSSISFSPTLFSNEFGKGDSLTIYFQSTYNLSVDKLTNFSCIRLNGNSNSLINLQDSDSHLSHIKTLFLSGDYSFSVTNSKSLYIEYQLYLLFPTSFHYSPFLFDNHHYYTFIYNGPINSEIFQSKLPFTRLMFTDIPYKLEFNSEGVDIFYTHDGQSLSLQQPILPIGFNITLSSSISISFEGSLNQVVTFIVNGASTNLRQPTLKVNSTCPYFNADHKIVFSGTNNI
jgi:hypothetical protein